MLNVNDKMNRHQLNAIVFGNAIDNTEMHSFQMMELHCLQLYYQYQLYIFFDGE